MRIIVVTGLSGAGRSAALRCFEDMDFFCVDNLPPKLIPMFAELCAGQNEGITDVALVMDVRGGDMFHDIYESLHWLKEHGHETELLYLEADRAAIVGRFDLTRRTHPLHHEGMTLEAAIEQETQMLAPLRKMADRIIDTTNLSARQLRSAIAKLYSGKRQITLPLVTIISFGFKYGVPLDADIIHDMRFLPNPYYIDSMRRCTGEDDAVAAYVMQSAQAQTYLDMVVSQTEFVLPLFAQEGKTDIVIGVGCTGGMHRSVAVANALYRRLSDDGQPVEIVHRDIMRDRAAEQAAKKES